jgi:hypothetical protein
MNGTDRMPDDAAAGWVDAAIGIGRLMAGRAGSCYDAGGFRSHMANSIYTIGHSNHSIDVFIALLRQHGIDVLADVRSSPYSKYCPQFNADVLKVALKNAGVGHVFLGAELGGRPGAAEFYDGDGRVLYWKIAETPAFRAGVDRVIHGSQTHRIALMCGEEDPTDCHRRLLVARVLEERGTSVMHIRGDGSVQSEKELAAELARKKDNGQQLLFEIGEPEWKSTLSVLDKSRPSSSSPP